MSEKKQPERGQGVSRRRFIGDTAKAAGAMCAVGLVLSFYARTVTARPAYAIRPPGALDEDKFLGTCVRCGLCVRACPYDTLRLAKLGDDVAPGTPYFVARETPCYLCQDIPCKNACPTGALDPGLTDIDDARMGVAVLIGHETCINLRFGQYCGVCYRACPLKEEAITLELHVMDEYPYQVPTVHTDKCTGCGKCEDACILGEAAIKVFPRKLATGQIGQNMPDHGVHDPRAMYGTTRSRAGYVEGGRRRGNWRGK
jgi:ferredoxin-type protein NapG